MSKDNLVCQQKQNLNSNYQLVYVKSKVNDNNNNPVGYDNSSDVYVASRLSDKFDKSMTVGELLDNTTTDRLI